MNEALEETMVFGVFKDIAALICLRYAMSRAGLAFFVHGFTAWPDGCLPEFGLRVMHMPKHWEPLKDRLPVDNPVDKKS